MDDRMRRRLKEKAEAKFKKPFNKPFKVDPIKNILGFKRQRMKEENVSQSFNQIEVVYYNDAITLIETCCRCCTNSNPATKFQDKCEYIEKRISSRHDSITEHSNIIMYIPNSLDADIPEILPGLRYLNIIRDQNGTYIAGSIRAYKYFIAHTNTDCHIPRMILECMKNCIPRSLMSDFTSAENGLLSRYDFPEYVGECNEDVKFTDDTDLLYAPYLYPIESDSELVEVINFDKVSKATIDFNIVSYTEAEEIVLPVISDIGVYDLLKMGTITVLFKNMSRAATHQLVRHRNAITQESQRYVNVEKNPTYVPTKEKYNNKKFDIILNGKKITTSLASLNEILKSVYPQLISQGMDKEDARGFLPTNTTCGKIYITFTWDNLMMFFKLRMDKAAQAEIREYALELYKIVEPHFNQIFLPYGYTLDQVVESIDSWYIQPTLFPGYNYDKEELLDDAYSDIDEIMESESE